MRNVIRVQLGRDPKREKVTRPPSDWGLHYDWSYIAFRFEIWMRSGFTVYPNAGGMDDQPQDLIDDFMTLLAEYDYQYGMRSEWLET